MNAISSTSSITRIRTVITVTVEKRLTIIDTFDHSLIRWVVATDTDLQQLAHLNHLGHTQLQAV